MLFKLFLLKCLMKFSNYFCVLIHIFQRLGHGDEMPPSPNVPSVDPNENREMEDVKDQAGAEKPGPHVA